MADPVESVQNLYARGNQQKKVLGLMEGSGTEQEKLKLTSCGRERMGRGNSDGKTERARKGL